MLLYRWVFQAAAASHLLWAAFLCFSQPRHRWGYRLQMRELERDRGVGVGAWQVQVHDAKLRRKLRATRRQLVCADRQVGVGFLVSAYFAQDIVVGASSVLASGGGAGLIAAGESAAAAGVRSAGGLLLWNGLFVLNFVVTNGLRWPSQSLIYGSMSTEDNFLILHAVASVVLSAIYLAHCAACYAVASSRARRRRPVTAAQGAEKHPQGVASQQALRVVEVAGAAGLGDYAPLPLGGYEPSAPSAPPPSLTIA